MPTHAAHSPAKAFLCQKLALPKTAGMHCVSSHQRHARDGALLRQGHKDFAQVVYKDPGTVDWGKILHRHTFQALQPIAHLETKKDFQGLSRNVRQKVRSCSALLRPGKDGMYTPGRRPRSRMTIETKTAHD